MAVILSLVLTVSGLVAIRSGRGPTLVREADDRQSLLTQVARLDEEFENGEDTAVARRAYERRRADLVGRIRSVR